MLTGTGIWSTALRYGDPGSVPDAAAELESLGYTAVWVPDFGGPVFDSLDALLRATSTITVATGVMNVWMQTAEAANTWWNALSSDHRSRVLLGLGVSHAPLIGEAWGRPLATMEAFLGALEVPREQRCLAALSPKMQQLARERTAGSLLYLVTPEHTATARENLGEGRFLAVAQNVVLDSDPKSARDVARQELAQVSKLPNYANNWKRAGFTDDDIASLSDPLVDAVFVCGDVDAIAERVAQHRAAGADHVCLQVAPGGELHPDVWKALRGV
ncbi:TIGR03620 family F420-dependent LLM class oxidoreductase [Pseudofrankia sp. BMG5.36]|uniref:TIGR03620 family F420-dependent LLM class oxidoreductase n=1 Tax=Pseudofrankia sp. BMG5.36 TaxID=1834512 RepID=UPI0008D8D9B5|nr:TIGR03620 family F420-dependent LLM class oxidoreductase [Pseudofrankia sp. BMG5.36]OHV43782.1 hypothetical protein BCD48_26545 [Pseudofrankia sp. BMG5.36]